jgi:hypothetical protein
MIPTIQIVDINDKLAEPDNGSEQISPTEDQVVEEIQQFFRYDPLNQYLSTIKLHALIKGKHQTWSLSEKRLKLIMKNNNLKNQLQQDQYLDKIEYPATSKPLPKELFSKFNELKGYSLHVSTNFRKDELIFTESKPVFFIPQLDHLNLTKASKACTYCGSLLSSLDHTSKKASFLNHLDCNNCNELWCSPDCKKKDKLHNLLKHNASKSNHLISSKNFDKFAMFCFENGVLQDLYAIAIIKSYFKIDDSLKDIYFSEFAKVGEDVRYGIKHPNSKIEEDEIYLKAFELFNEIFINDLIEWDEFLLMLGIYNLNNYECSIFQIQPLINHDCEPNVRIELSEDKLNNGIKIIANRDIKENEQLTISYVNPHFDMNSRLKQLRLNYGFICHCDKCQNDDKVLQRRKSSNAQHLNSLKEFKELMKNSKVNEFDLNLPNGDEFGETERRKSVRFNEKVIAVNES